MKNRENVKLEEYLKIISGFLCSHSEKNVL